MGILQLIRIIMLLLASLIENILLYNWVITGNIPFFLYVIIHCLVVLGMYVYIERYDRSGIKIPLYIGLLIPGMGMILLLFLYIGLFTIKAKGSIIDDYKEYVDYIYNKITINKLNFDKEVNVLSAYDSLSLLNEHKKKNMIIDLISDDIEIKTNILKSALNDKDTEVVHYASSILNLVEEEFDKKMNALKDTYNSRGSKESLHELITIYEEYLNSGLIDEGLLVFEQEEFLEIIENYNSQFGSVREFELMKVRILIKMNRNDEALYALEPLGKSGQVDEEFILKIEALHNLKKYKQVALLANLLRITGAEIPDEYKGIIEYWT